MKEMLDVAEAQAVIRLVVFTLARQRYGLALATVERALPMLSLIHI